MLVKCKIWLAISFLFQEILLKIIFFCLEMLLNMLKECTFASVFHGIRFKVSKDWLSG